mmetsp:Transcript_10813/g.19096  ORF Transcript_10813/g.19096 Transcript_10813/m.19096 type:complete len:83 (+) Transcript_10813:106-354(+)|eukprot:CAMPEP_0184526494 /NCGR_PEP_ID=MMETSP0198_2-20121128/10684_1 /TAXON_ID=1112570 /ORGANISM="Thraustochytrium sp., Strain LLF1b" /LENGTH=82 /DNA_ID=CAMNT_0026918069 /DNA_START=206 /DNA_END=454 /DNA_ORIENTATION=+
MAMRFFRQVADSEPMLIASLGVASIGLGAIVVVPRVRYALGMPTEQYYGLEDPETGKLRGPIGPVPKFVRSAIGMKPELSED